MNPEDVESAVFMYRLLVAGNLLLSLINSILVLILFLRRKTPLDKELAKFVSRHDCDDHHKIESDKRAALYAYVQERFDSGSLQFLSIERTLGRIEGKLEELKRGKGSPE